MPYLECFIWRHFNFHPLQHPDSTTWLLSTTWLTRTTRDDQLWKSSFVSPSPVTHRTLPTYELMSYPPSSESSKTQSAAHIARTYTASFGFGPRDYRKYLPWFGVCSVLWQSNVLNPPAWLLSLSLTLFVTSTDGKRSTNLGIAARVGWAGLLSLTSFLCLHFILL